MRKVIFTLSFIFLITLVSIAQTRTINGTVTSADDGYTLPGVSVIIKGTTQGTITDTDGKFKLSGVSATTVLAFSFIGFTPVEITVNEQQIINVSLKSEARKLDEFVVTALGVKREKREIG